MHCSLRGIVSWGALWKAIVSEAERRGSAMWPRQVARGRLGVRSVTNLFSMAMLFCVRICLD